MENVLLSNGLYTEGSLIVLMDGCVWVITVWSVKKPCLSHCVTSPFITSVTVCVIVSDFGSV